MALTTLAFKPIVARPAATRTSQPRQRVVCAAHKSSETFSRIAGAALAIQLAVLPVAGMVQAGELQDLKSGAKASDEKTSNLPSLPDVGKALFGGGKDLQEEARASDRATSNLPSLPQVGKAAFGKGGAVDQAAEELAGEAQQAEKAAESVAK